MKRIILLCLAALAILEAAPAISQPREAGIQVVPPGEMRSVAPNIYLDCSRRDCDFDFIKTEITFVNYVRDRQSADIHIIVTRQTTGSGGGDYTISFIGLKMHEGKDATLHYFSRPTDTEDQVRKGLTNILKQGLIPYVYDTPLSEFISVSYAQNLAFRPPSSQDKWNYWVFSVGLRGNGDFEELSERYSYRINLSANRTTEATKFRLWASSNIDNRRYEVSEEETIISKTSRKYLSGSLIRSIDGHWSWGATASLYSSTYDNAELYASFGPAIEYNIFPYDQATRRELRIQYRIGYSQRDYYETTIFNKEEEGLFNQNLQVILELKEPWGSGGVELSGSTFLHDLSKNNLRAEAGIWVNLYKGLSFNVGGEYSRVRDQLSLPQEDVSKEEILLELKRLASSYNLRVEMGFNYRFGSIYSNIVNPRFGNM
ncbi:MAG: hypothetical protein WBC70_11790 [Candidatus Aminicenantales bacterium]